MVRSYRDLRVWQLAMNLVEKTYEMTRAFPREEMYVLTHQMRRSAVSIPSNVAEGHSRAGTREFLHHLSIASASLSELETQTEVSRRLGYLSEDNYRDFAKTADSLGRQLGSLRRSISRPASPQPPAPSPQRRPWNA